MRISTRSLSISDSRLLCASSALNALTMCMPVKADSRWSFVFDTHFCDSSM